ncbi:MAG TPA: hypothetical protein VEU07_15720, partial [Candidatus Acidoferrum sp.]|nr:hypothetical protein [Candidatus Acidoferrum sp.]
MEQHGEGKVDLREHGANQQIFDRRLFVQLQVFTGCQETKPLIAALEASQIEAVLYLDIGDPTGVGVLSMSEDPTFFVTGLRELLGSPPFGGLRRRPDLTMLGRSYSSGFEPDLQEYLL